MSDEGRARRLANDQRFENALAALQDTVYTGDNDLAVVGAITASMAMAVFAAFASILEAKGLVTLEESLDTLVQVMEKMAENAKQNRRLQSILGQQ